MDKFNEREFELVYTAEFIRAHNDFLAESPICPTLQEESRLGYDVELRLKAGKRIKSFFLQHKVSTYHNRWHPHHRVKPYYKFNIHRLKKSRQHNLLVCLANRGESVFYNAPEFHLRRDLIKNFVGNNIIDCSVLFKPSEMGMIVDDEQHTVSYTIQDYYGFFQSDPVNIVKHRTKEVLRSLKDISKAYVAKILNDLKECYKEVYGYEYRIPEKLIDVQNKDSLILKHILNEVYMLEWFLIELKDDKNEDVFSQKPKG